MSNNEYIRPNFATHVDIETNMDLAFEVFDHLMSLSQNNQSPYDEFILPQEYRPDSLRPGGEYYGTKEHAMFYFNSCAYMSKRTVSEWAIKRMAQLFEEEPALFNCEELGDMPDDYVAGRLKDVGFGVYNVASRELTENARRMQENYDGNPVNIFTTANDWDECKKRIRNDKKGGGFLGFQKKMTSMILYYFQYDELIKELNYPIPADSHNQRIMLSTEIIVPSDPVFYKHMNGVENTCRQVSAEYSINRGISTVALTDAIWPLSANLCGKTPGNISSHKKIDGVMQYKFTSPDVENLKDAEKYHRTCGRCALRDYCKNYVPLGTYYNSGGWVLLPKEHESRDFIEQLYLHLDD